MITQTTSSLICLSGYESKDSWKVPGHDSESSVTLPLRAKESSCLGHTLGPGKEMKGMVRVLPQECLRNPGTLIQCLQDFLVLCRVLWGCK